MGIHSPNFIANAYLSCATHNPEGEFVIFGDHRITWGEMTPRVLRIAQALSKLGVQRGEKVAFMFHNTPEFIEINAAIQVAGGVPSPMNYRFMPREVQYQAQHSDARVMIYDSIWAETVEPALPDVPNLEHLVCRGPCGLDGALDYEEFVASGEETDPGVATEPEDVAVMIYTGGTTGFPKGVMLTYGAHFRMFASLYASAVVRALTMDVPLERHRRLIEALPMPAKPLVGVVLRSKTFKRLMRRPGTFEFLRKQTYKQFTDTERARRRYGNATKSMYPSMPFFHDAAYANLMSGTLAGMSSYVLPDTVSFDPGLVLQLVEREEVAMMGNVPTGWKKLVSYPDAKKFDTSSVKLAATGGGACPAALKRQIFEIFPNVVIIDAFGQTEMTPVTSFRLDAAPETLVDRSVGKAIVEAKIVDEGGAEVPQGEIGEILYRSDTVMKGYYKDDEKTREVMEDGWFRSGDLGYFDENGEIRTVDRKKECINTGGEKVFPLEVEEIIQTHPKVDAVCVIGVPDEEWGNTVRAVVQLKPGEQVDPEEIREHCRGELAGYKIPRTVVFTEEIPFSPVGKLLRQQVRDTHGRPD
jgi:acyl-CoA synthetase (AMP-forming)/AMP-acid ligase II